MEKTSKEKWTEALLVLASVFFAIGIIFLFVWGGATFFSWMNKPDPRSVEEIKIERYKGCISYTNATEVKKCELLLELKSN